VWRLSLSGDSPTQGEHPSRKLGTRKIGEAIGSERRPTVVRITVELVEVTRQGRSEGTRCRSDLIPPTKLKHKGWDGLGSSVRVRVGGRVPVRSTNAATGVREAKGLPISNKRGTQLWGQLFNGVFSSQRFLSL